MGSQSRMRRSNQARKTCRCPGKGVIEQTGQGHLSQEHEFLYPICRNSQSGFCFLQLHLIGRHRLSNKTHRMESGFLGLLEATAARSTLKVFPTQAWLVGLVPKTEQIQFLNLRRKPNPFWGLVRPWWAVFWNDILIFSHRKWGYCVSQITRCDEWYLLVSHPRWDFTEVSVASNHLVSKLRTTTVYWHSGLLATLSVTTVLWTALYSLF